jgi:hypothetical protein
LRKKKEEREKRSRNRNKSERERNEIEKKGEEKSETECNFKGIALTACHCGPSWTSRPSSHSCCRLEWDGNCKKCII